MNWSLFAHKPIDLAYVTTSTFDLTLLMFLILLENMRVDIPIQSKKGCHFCTIAVVLLQSLQMQFSLSGYRAIFSRLNFKYIGFYFVTVIRQHEILFKQTKMFLISYIIAFCYRLFHYIHFISIWFVSQREKEIENPTAKRYLKTVPKMWIIR